jgi:valyl-tRNA synthetase
MFDDFMTYLKRFSFSDVKLINDNKAAKGEGHVYNEAELYIANEANKDELLAKLDKEIENLKNEIKRCENMLNNPSFLAKAPADKVSLEREKLQKHLDNLKVLEEKKKNL